ncbi:MAG: iron-containing alcohol dehydrogenase [Ethanoligenens sp.]
MQNFNFKMSTQVVFGIGTALKTVSCCKKLNGSKVFLMSGPNIAKTEIFSQLVSSMEQGGIPCIVYTDVSPEPTVEKVDRGAKALKDSGCDLVIAVGGGSTIDMAKALAMLKNNDGSVQDYLHGGTKNVTQPSLPLIAIPTTAGSGSEVTAASVITDCLHNIKLSVTHPYLVPKIAVIDPMLHQGMPPFITATTGMDALTHAIEAYVSMDANPISDAYAAEAIGLIASSLREATRNPTNIEARSTMAAASLLAGLAFTNGGLGAVHGISQAMGGIAHVAHGLGNAVMLPHVMEYNIAGKPRKFAKIAQLLGEKTDGESVQTASMKAVGAVRKLCEDLHIPLRIREVGITQEMFPNIVEETMKYRLLPQNPVVLKARDVYSILQNAF